MAASEQKKERTNDLRKKKKTLKEKYLTVLEFKVSAAETVVTRRGKSLETQGMSHITLGFVFLGKQLELNSGSNKVAQKDLGQEGNKTRAEDEFGGWKQQDNLADDFIIQERSNDDQIQGKGTEMKKTT